MINLEESSGGKSREDLQAEFLNELEAIRDYWLAEDRQPRPEDKVDGIIFSILVLIDGFGSSAGPYPLIALQEQGEDMDLSGDLHDRWGDRRRQERRRKQG